MSSMRTVSRRNFLIGVAAAAVASRLPAPVAETLADWGFLPPGFLPLDGRSVSRHAYPELFSVVGTTFGDGDGSTTFTLPNMGRGELSLVEWLNPSIKHGICATKGYDDLFPVGAIVAVTLPTKDTST